MSTTLSWIKKTGSSLEGMEAKMVAAKSKLADLQQGVGGKVDIGQVRKAQDSSAALQKKMGEKQGWRCLVEASGTESSASPLWNIAGTNHAALSHVRLGFYEWLDEITEPCRSLWSDGGSNARGVLNQERVRL